MSRNSANRLSFSSDDERPQRQAGNKKLACHTLSKCGLRGHGFVTNEHLELYYDIETLENRDVGYISKGWEDPGFRVGNVVKVPTGQIEARKASLPMLMNHCATRGVAMTGERLAGGTFEFHLDSVIYTDGFNPKVLAQVLECLTDCTEKVRAIFASHD